MAEVSAASPRPQRRSIGFDIGGTNVRGVALDETGAVVAQRRQPRPDSTDDLIDAIDGIAVELQDEAGRVEAFGVGCAGCVDTDGVVLTSPNIASLVNFPLQARLEERTGLGVVVDNDATTATWAEAVTGAGRGYANIVFVAFGTGIGGGLVIDGQLRRGAYGLAGEVGHMVVEPGGQVCVCGRAGCWEQHASGTALGRMARVAAAEGRADGLARAVAGDIAAIRGEHVAAALQHNDPDAVALIEALAVNIAVGLNNLVMVLDPEVIVIGGGLGDMGAGFFGPVERAFQAAMIDRHHRPSIPILGAVHGDRAGALGAALLAADI